MATQQQQRQAIGRRITASRQGTGAAERQATGQRIITERTGKAVSEDINRLITPPRQSRILRDVPAVGAIPASTGRGSYKPPETGGGIASPITEEDFATREYWPNGLTSSDGLFILPAVKKIVAVDANGAEEVRHYAEPVPL